MSSQSCTACNDLREYAPDFVLNGVNDDTCCHLYKNEGLSGADDHTNFDDLHDVNDCLIGNMQDELDAFDVCEWKDYMNELVGNMYETLKAMICSQCGILAKLSLLTFTPEVKAFRNGGTSSSSVTYSSLTADADIGTLKVYMDADDNDDANASPSGTYGSTPADRDYIAMLTWCADGNTLGTDRTSVQVSVRNNTQTADYAQLRAQHFSVKGVDRLSTNQTAFCYLPEGGHLLVRQHCTYAGGSNAQFRVHQFSMVLMPIVNADIECE